MLTFNQLGILIAIRDFQGEGMMKDLDLTRQEEFLRIQPEWEEGVLNELQEAGHIKRGAATKWPQGSRLIWLITEKGLDAIPGPDSEPETDERSGMHQ